MEALHVRKQGNTCTVFLDDASRPLAISSADVAPLGMPFTFHRGELEQRFPGKHYVFHERVVAAPPSMADLIPSERSAAIEADVERVMKAGPGQASAVAPPMTPTPDHGRTLVEAFGAQSQLARAGSDEDRRDLEAVGSFLISTFPELEPMLQEAAKPRAAVTKKRFTLGE